MGLLDGYWDHVIPFLAPDLQPWARHLQKGTLQEAVRNIVDIEGMMADLENRKNAFLKLFEYQLRPDFYNATTKELVIAGKGFSLSMATGNEDCLVDHTPRLIYDQDSSTPIVTVESDQTLTIQLGKKENPTTVGELESTLTNLPEITSVTSVIDDRGDQLLKNNYNHGTQKLTLCGKIFTLKLASDDSDALQDHTPNVGLITHATPKVSIENDIFTIQLGKKEHPTTAGQLQETLQKGMGIRLVSFNSGAVTTALIPSDDQASLDTYDSVTRILTICGTEFTLQFTSGNENLLENSQLITRYTQDTILPIVEINNQSLEIGIGAAATPSTIYQLKEVMEAMPEIASLEGAFPTLQIATRESIECIFPLLKSMISQVLGDYSDTDNEKSGSLAHVIEVPFKLAALFTELALNHIPLPKAFKDFLTGTPKPGEAPVSAGCLLLALPYAALEQVLELILTTQEKEQQNVA